MRKFDDVLVKSFIEMMEKCYDSLEKDGWQSFCTELRDQLNDIGLNALKQALEQVNKKFLEQRDLRSDWVVERHGDTKSILTPFGALEYERSYFRHKKTGKHAYLADRFAGYTSHQRLDSNLESELVKDATEMSYAKAGKQAEYRAKGTRVTDTTVMNVVRKLRPERYEFIPKESKKRVCSTLYIEADEDHVANQVREGKGINRFEQKLIYIHEGRKTVGKNRKALKNAFYFTVDPGTPTNKIWEKVWRYIQNTYDSESIENIYVAGDGAGWIKAGVDYLPNSHFVLDRFHLQQSTLRVAGQDKEKLKQLNKAIWTDKRSEVKKLFQELHREAASESRQKTIEQNYKYIINNWGGIQTHRTCQGERISCSAEGHVSHILSARLSSRPMGWTKHGANQMSHLRIHQANGVDIKEIYTNYEKKRQQSENILLSKGDVKKLKKAVGTTNESLDNMPQLQNKNGPWTNVLRGIRTRNIFTL